MENWIKELVAKQQVEEYELYLTKNEMAVVKEVIIDRQWGTSCFNDLPDLDGEELKNYIYAAAEITGKYNDIAGVYQNHQWINPNKNGEYKISLSPMAISELKEYACGVDDYFCMGCDDPNDYLEKSNGMNLETWEKHLESLCNKCDKCLEQIKKSIRLDNQLEASASYIKQDIKSKGGR